jgi:hypothetical protein
MVVIGFTDLPPGDPARVRGSRSGRSRRSRRP